MTPLELPAWLITLMNVTQDIKMEPRLASPPPAWTGAMLLEMSASATPYVLGDRGYLCSATMWGGEPLAEGVRIIAPVRENMADPLSPELRGRLNARRRIVETVNAQLAGRLEMERIWARDRWHLTARGARKELAHNLNCHLNKLNGRRPLLFSKLITVA